MKKEIILGTLVGVVTASAIMKSKPTEAKMKRLKRQALNKVEQLFD